MSLRVITTNAGKAAILAAEAAGLEVSITHLAAGASGYTPSVTRTTLADERERVAISSSRVDAAAYRLDINAALDSAEEYWVREVGFFDSNGVLIWIWSAPEAEFTLGYKSAPVRFLLGLSLTITDAPLDSIQIIDAGQPLELSLALIEEDLNGVHPEGEPHNYDGTSWRETDWLAQTSQWEAVAEMVRAQGQSGIVSSRQYERAGTEAFNRTVDGAYSALNIHNHPNYPQMCGIAEISAAINGYYVRTRHNDYRLKRAISGDYLATEDVPPPAVPSSVSALPAVADQITEMRAYFQALSARSTSPRDYRPHFRWTLSAMEIWPEILPADREFVETFASFRHIEDEQEMRAQLEIILERGATGYKGRFENVSLIPGSVRQVLINGTPQWVLWRYRIICADVGSLADYPIDTFLTLRDRPIERWHTGSAFNAQPASRRARYSINRALAEDHFEGSYFGPDLLDTLMGKLPGLSGSGASITETYTDDGTDYTITKHGTATALNAGYYSRRYSMPSDASGRVNQIRGFNDPTLFMALTNRPEVQPVAHGSRAYRASYAIPLELILRTPLETWNPYALPKIPDTTAMTGSGTSGNPYAGYRDNSYYYLTPSSFFSGAASGADEADTDPGVVYVLDAGSVARQVRAAGLYVHLPAISGVSEDLRTRYPIYPLYHEGSYAQALVESVSGDLGRANLALGNELMRQRATIEDLSNRVRAAEGWLANLAGVTP